MKLLVLCLYLQVLEGEVAELIDFILFLDIEEGVTLAIAVAHHDVVGIGEGSVLPALEVIELLPRGYEEKIANRTCDILYSNVFVALRGVWTHF